MLIKETALAGVLLVQPKVFRDSRGYFYEDFHNDKYINLFGSSPRCQDNVSCTYKGFIRGLHYQWPYPQGKLISVLYGQIFDVVVDVRRGSPTYGKWIGEILNDETCLQIWVPPGFAHGFQTISEKAVVTYKCTDNNWDPSCSRTVSYKDPALRINWPLKEAKANSRDENAAFLESCADIPTYSG